MLIAESRHYAPRGVRLYEAVLEQIGFVRHPRWFPQSSPMAAARVFKPHGAAVEFLDHASRSTFRST